MLGENASVIHLEIKKGAIYRYNGKDQEPTRFNFVTGIITKLRYQLKEIKNAKIPFMYIDLYDPESGEKYDVQTPIFKGAGPNILMSLKSAIDTMGGIKDKVVKISAYTKTKNDIDYTNAVVYLGDQKLSWAQLPANVKAADALKDIFDEINAHVVEETGAAADGVDAPSADYEEPDSEDIPEGTYNPFEKS